MLAPSKKRAWETRPNFIKENEQAISSMLAMMGPAKKVPEYAFAVNQLLNRKRGVAGCTSGGAGVAQTSSWRHGAPNTNRTCDLPLRRGLLYPLSYRGDERILA
jgi:hypothetical protein